MTTQPNGTRVGGMTCWPEPEGALNVRSVGVTAYQRGVGTHDASELRIVCDVTAGGCEGIASVVVLFEIEPTPQGVTAHEITSFNADAKSGTFTLDAFTDDGRVSGSMDLTMTEGAYTVRIKGRFEANMRDCGPFNGTGACMGAP